MAFQADGHWAEGRNAPLQLPFSTHLLKKVRSLWLSPRADNCLRSVDIIYLGDLVQETEADLKQIWSLGPVTLNEIKDALAQMGLQLGTEVPSWPPENLDELAARFEDHF